MQTADDRKVIKFALIGSILFIIALFAYLSYSGSKSRSNAHVGDTLYIGDEHKSIKYKDKEDLEIELRDFEKRTKIKLLFYIIKKIKYINKGESLAELKKIEGQEIKVFLSIQNPSVAVFYGEGIESKLDKNEFNQFIEGSIIMQLNVDLFDTAISDITEFLSGGLKLKSSF